MGGSSRHEPEIQLPRRNRRTGQPYLHYIFILDKSELQ
jgi:hypothetical protein